jgi:hypothetical protein
MIVRSGTGRISCEEILTQKVTPFLKRNMPHQFNNLLYSLWPSVVLCVLCVNDFVFQLRFLGQFICWHPCRGAIDTNLFPVASLRSATGYML